LGHLTCKIVSEMTYNVSSGMLNPTIHTIPFNQYQSIYTAWRERHVCEQLVELLYMYHYVKT